MVTRKKIFRCILCNEFSFDVICNKCQTKYLKPNVIFKDGVVSFYDYESIEFLVKYKYHKFGHRIFQILANNSFKLFANEIKENFFVIPIDDNIKKGYSHTAILANSMKTNYVKPLFSTLIAINSVKYAGESLEFRLNNPRNFKYSGPNDIDVILVDDLKTTGLTLNEAEEKLKEFGVNIYLKVVLSDLSRE